MTRKPCSVWIGFDPRESAAFAVARRSAERRLNIPIPIYGLVLEDLKSLGLYRRPTEKRKSAADGDITWDLVSDAPVATEFSNSRFLIPQMASRVTNREYENARGWALFMDCDVLVRGNLRELFEIADPTKAVMCVKHDHRPVGATKMDGQIQTVYGRKNWSSVCLWNLDHPAHKKLTLEMVNECPGRDLHRFCWIEDEEIGELGPEWNFLVGHTSANVDPKIVHFTDGIPLMKGYADVPYADEWRRELFDWAYTMGRGIAV